MSRVCMLAIALALLAGCAEVTKQAVYIPTKCKTKPLPKPTPSKERSISQEVAEIFAYTEMLERDLEFCRGE